MVAKLVLEDVGAIDVPAAAVCLVLVSCSHVSGLHYSSAFGTLAKS
jgi:hypothetical protein